MYRNILKANLKGIMIVVISKAKICYFQLILLYCGVIIVLGHVLAFYNLAVMHASGTGVLRSCNMATDVCCIIFLLDVVLNIIIMYVQITVWQEVEISTHVNIWTGHLHCNVTFRLGIAKFFASFFNHVLPLALKSPIGGVVS